MEDVRNSIPWKMPFILKTGKGESNINRKQEILISVDHLAWQLGNQELGIREFGNPCIMMELQIIATLVISCLDVWMSSIFHKANNLMLRGPLISRCFPPNELANMLERICRKLGTIIYELVIATKLGLDQQSSFCQVLQTERVDKKSLL